MSFNEDLTTPEQPQPERRRGCLLAAISGVIIISLLVTSASGFVMFIREQLSENAETPTAANIVQTEESAEKIDEQAGQSNDELAHDDTVGNDPFTLSNQQLNRIVLVNEERQIETVAPDGSHRHVLTGDDHFYEFPAWSPDGSQIAALGNDRSGGGVFLLHDVESASAEQELYFSQTRRPFYLYWSPDGKQISFLANNPIDGIGLNIIGATVGQESKEIASGSPLYWNWAADSRQLLIHSGDQDDDSRLVMIDNAGEDQAPGIPSPGFFQAPGISPSGQFWAYAQLREGGLSWITIDDQINGEQNAERHAGAIALNWSPVSDKLAYISGSDDGEFSFWGPLRMLDTASGETRLLSSNLVLAFFWSPDGKKILTITVPSSGGLNGGVEVRDTKNRHLARQRQAIPPAQRSPHRFVISVIDVERGTGLELAEVSLSSTFLSQFLVYFDQYALSHTLWSPDSQFVVLPIVAEGEPQIVVFSTESGRRQQVGSGFMAFWSRQ